MSGFRLLKARIVWLLLIAASFTISVTHGGPLAAGPVVLIGVVFGQLWLPGLLTLRVLGEPPGLHPFARLPWALVAGLGVTISLGAVHHLAHIPIPTYVLLLHGYMLILALLPARQPLETHPQLSRRSLPLYVLLVVCCVITVSIAVQRNGYRFTGYEDQTYFISNAAWLIDVPEDSERTSRQAGNYGDRRFETDGWTYSHAAWSWSSGISSDDLIWSDLTWLFAWVTPLAVFALTYEATRRESAGVFSAAGLVLAGLMLLDPFAYLDDSRAFGQNALFQVNTLRTFSITLMMPLALMTLLSYLRRPGIRIFILLIVAGSALAILHPRQVIYYSVLTAACAGLWFIAQPGRARFLPTAALAVLTAGMLVLPSWQYFVPDTLRAYFESAQVSSTPTPNQTPSAAPTSDIEAPAPPALTIAEVPGPTENILEPSPLFYHPLLIAAAVIGLLLVVRWRRDLLTMYVVSATAATLVFVYLPGWPDFAARAFGSVHYGVSLITWATVMLPVAPALGLALDFVVSKTGKYSAWIGTTAITLLFGLLIFEPIPIPASAQDQLRSANALQSLRDRPAFQTELLNTLLPLMPPDGISTVLTETELAGAVNEVIPRTLVVTGRNTSVDLVYERGLRFYAPTTPWLDLYDLELIHELNIAYLVIDLTDSRLSQVELTPRLFEPLAEAAAYRIYRITPQPTADSVDERFAHMNEVMRSAPDQRVSDGFYLARAGDPIWQPFLSEWQGDAARGDDRARYGLAMTALLAGDDDQALPLWEDLHTRYPDVPFFGLALAYTLRENGREAEALSVLMQRSGGDPVGLMAVRALLTPEFFYLLSPSDIERLISLTESNPTVWSQLAEYDQPPAIRQRAALLMRAGYYTQASTWLERIPTIVQTPRDLLTLSLLDLASGQRDSALARLKRAEDPDIFLPNRFFNPEAWRSDGLLVTYQAMQRGDETSWLAASQASALPLVSLHTEINGGQVEVEAWAADLPLMPAQGWSARLLSPDGTTQYAESEIAAIPPQEGQLTRLNFVLQIPDDTADLTPMRLIIQPLYDDGLQPSMTADLWLPLPAPAQLPTSLASASITTFGEGIQLLGAEAAVEAETLDLVLYWQVTTEVANDLQVFVHILDANNQLVTQQDAQPLQNRYPFHMMPQNVIIRDERALPISQLITGEYRIIAGVYRLSDQIRLPAAGTNAGRDYAEVLRFSLER